ncbi:hypothetical protein HPC49_40270 [Pyxidicoccus fallax]|nr:hypothetical protein [Pyxidicoccus fallax]NPC84436.1 hypothetical protein [Pyxidicoccus fallax]
MPLPTWNLTEQAERIVVGRVVRQWRVESTPWDGAPPSETENDRIIREALRELSSRERVDIEVLEVWKGAPAKTLTVIADPYWNLLGGALERYGKDHRLLLFLESSDEDWRTTGYLSDRRLEKTDVPAWRERVMSAVALQAFPPVNEAALVDWNALALLHPATRWDALDALYSSVLKGYRSDPRFRAPRPNPLSPVAQRRFAESFLADPGPPRSVSGMLLALDGYAHPEVDRVAARLIEEALRYEGEGKDAFYILWEAQDAMDLMVSRLGASGPGTERCVTGDKAREATPALTHCVHARWRQLRALLPKPSP